jgi:hypothetical protein
MSTDPNARPHVSSASSESPTPLPLPAPPPSEPGRSWWGPAFEPRDEGWPQRYVPLPPPPAPRWSWRWSPLIGFMYGPIPVGLIAAVVLLLAVYG